MAKIEKLDDHRKGDRLTAHLAMAAAEEPETAGGCLTSEQLADVAAGCCTPEERKAALAHFAGCRKCYDAWVAVSLSLVAMESGLERRKRPLLSLRNLGYLGSAFAVAASVVLFLQIRQAPQETLMTPPERSTEGVRQLAPAQEQRSPESVRQLAPTEDTGRILRREKVAGEAPAPSAAARNKVEAPVPQPVAGAGVRDAEKKTAPAAPAAENKASEAAVADMAAENAERKAQPSATEWLTRVEESCRGKSYRQDPEGWNRLLGQAGAVESVDPRLRERLAAVQAILAAKNLGPEEQCRSILQLLAVGGERE